MGEHYLKQSHVGYFIDEEKSSDWLVIAALILEVVKLINQRLLSSY